MLVRPTPVATHTSSARTVDEAVAALSTAYSDVKLRLPAAGEPVELRLESHALPNVTLGDLRLTRATVSSASFPWFAVCVPVSGHIRISTPSATTLVGDGHGAIVTPGDRVQVEYLSERCRMQTLLFDRSRLEEELGMMLGRAPHVPLDFEFGFAHSGRDAFGRSLSLLATELDGPDGLAAVPALAPRLGRLLMAGLLTSCRHNFSDALLDPDGDRRPKPIRVAIDAIEANPAAIETVSDISSIAGLSVRALDAGFRQYVGVSPMKYLRQVRLARAHQALLAADAEATTATAVARDCGFLHYGRFAADYRQVYGATPSGTLKSGQANR